MSDGMSDASAVGAMGARVERCAGDLVRAMYAGRGGHRGLAIDELSTVNDVFKMYGLRVVAEHDYDERIERAARLLRWGRKSKCGVSGCGCLGWVE